MELGIRPLFPPIPSTPPSPPPLPQDPIMGGVKIKLDAKKLSIGMY